MDLNSLYQQANSDIKVTYKKIKGGNVPQYDRPGSSGLTVYCTYPIKVPAWQSVSIPTGILFPLGLPDGVEIQVRNIKENLEKNRLVFQDTGDNDYKDEYHVLMINFSPSIIELKRNDKLCQIVFSYVFKPQLERTYDSEV